jgi:hypothetical protein
MVQYLTAVSLDQENHDKNPWFRNLLQHPSTNEIMIENLWFSNLLQHPSTNENMIESLGPVPYCSIPRSRKS